jgi:AAA15 family ATPase/GTPase
MILKALKYSSVWKGKWSIISGTTEDDFVSFENINLIVGRNASGKTRLIDVIRWISDLLDADSRIEVLDDEIASFELILQNKKDEIKYNVGYDKDNLIFREELFVNDNIKLNRKTGKLYYEKYGDFLDFETDNEYLAISRRDNLQQPFFEVLHTWGKNLAHFSFGGNMGKGQHKKDTLKHQEDFNFKNSNNVGATHSKGLKEYGVIFQQKVIDDMNLIDYKLDSISFDTASKYLFIKVKESDLENETYFENMSQGMARAFSLIVQLNYSLMAKIPSCILIDDIGEGLDYDRSKKLIELIIEKAEGSNIQVFMTTNDRFVMNSVPLKYWSVIHREGNKSVFYNYQNSKQTFDDFAFTGLNNFDFFATEFYRQGFEEFIATAQ